MSHISRLFERLYFSKNPLYQAELLHSYLQESREPFGSALAFLMGLGPSGKVPTRSLKRELMQRIDARLFDLSYRFVKELPDTLSRLWCPKSSHPIQRVDLRLSDVEICLQQSDSKLRMASVCELLDRLDDADRWLLIKLASGYNWNIESKVFYRAFGQFFNLDPCVIEARWYPIKKDPHQIDSWLQGGQVSVLEVPAGAHFHPMPEVRSCSMEAFKEVNAGQLEGSLVAIPGQDIYQWVKTDAQCCAYSRDGFEMPELVLNEAYASLENGVYIIALKNPDAPGEGVLFISRLDAGQFGPESIPLKSSMPCKLSIESMGTSSHGGWLIFQPKLPSQPWYVVYPQKTSVQMVLLYYAPGNHHTGDTLTLGLKHGTSEWVSIVSVSTGKNSMFDQYFEDWKQSNRIKKTGPVIEVKKALVVEIDYQRILVNKRRKCGIELDRPSFKRFCWELDVRKIVEFETWFANNSIPEQ